MQYADDNSNRFPDPQALDQSWEKCLSAYISNPDPFRCPGDQEIYPILGSSYDWRDTGVFQTTLAGRAFYDMNRSNAVLAFESLPGWHAKQKMNAAFLDGSAQVMDQQACLADLQSPIRDAAGP